MLLLTNAFFLRPNGIGATSRPSTVTLSETGSSSVNFLGCTFDAQDAQFGPTVQVGYAIDNIFLNSGLSTDVSNLLVYPMNGGLFSNNTFDNSLEDVGTAFLRLGGSTAPNVIQSRLEGLTLVSGALVYANTATGANAATEAITIDVPNYNVQDPLLFSEFGFSSQTTAPSALATGRAYVSTVRTGSPGNVPVGFRMREVETWETYTYPGPLLNRVQGRALTNQGAISGREGNFRCVLTATYNPLFFDDAQAVSDADRQAAGIPNVVTNITRGLTMVLVEEPLIFSTIHPQIITSPLS